MPRKMRDIRGRNRRFRSLLPRQKRETVVKCNSRETGLLDSLLHAALTSLFFKHLRDLPHVAFMAFPLLI